MGKPENAEEFEHFKTEDDNFDVYIHKEILSELKDKQELKFFIEGYGSYVLKFLE
jgi:hypothetical protein